MSADLSRTVQSTILVIDADTSTTRVLRRALGETVPHRLLAVQDVLCALRVAPGMTPTMILLDGRTPDMDAQTSLMLLKTHPATRSAPVVVMTDRLLPSDMEAAYRAGAHAHVLKPLQQDRLMAAVVAALGSAPAS